VQECLVEHGARPAELAQQLGLLGPRFTAVHAVHLEANEKKLLGDSQSTVCACPTTERNLGDGIVDPSFTFVALGTDSQVQIAPLEDARELEYHLRLQRLERAVLAPREQAGDRSALAQRLFAAASADGARSLGSGRGTLEPGESADFFTVDLADPSVAGAEPADLLSAVVFSLERTAIREVVVQGRAVVREGRHAQQDEIVRSYSAAAKRLWEGA
jgi:formimidoylglutamate deiminase